MITMSWRDCTHANQGGTIGVLIEKVQERESQQKRSRQAGLKRDSFLCLIF